MSTWLLSIAYNECLTFAARCTKRAFVSGTEVFDLQVGENEDGLDALGLKAWQLSYLRGCLSRIETFWRCDFVTIYLFARSRAVREWD
ncbi:MAG: hypothetical protein ACI8PT_002577 [Gammaproteobacteria bacterium]